MASARRSSTPRRAMARVAASCADGAASDSAHGQVTISTDTATHTARDGSSTLHTAAAPAASSNTPHKNGAAHRSAAGCDAGRCVRASRVIATMASKRVSAPTHSTRIATGAPRFTLPASTALPVLLVTGADSPLSNDSSTCVLPCVNTPSAQNASPIGTRSRSPGCSRKALTCVTLPSAFSRSAVSGSWPVPASSHAAARWRARISR